MAMSKCVECGREVSDEAPTCPGCGKPRPVKKKLGWGAKIGIGFLALMILGMIIPNMGKDRRGPAQAGAAASAAPAAQVAPDVQVGAEELWRAYQSNEVAADSVYKGKQLLVTGAVDSITKDAFDSVIVSLRAPNQFMPTMAYLDSSGVEIAAKLRKGQGIRVLCRGEGMFASRPVLRDCTITAVGQ